MKYSGGRRRCLILSDAVNQHSSQARKVLLRLTATLTGVGEKISMSRLVDIFVSMSPSLPHWLTNIIRQVGVYPHDSATSTHSVTSFDLQHFHLEMYKSNLGLTIKRINSTLTQQKTRCEVHNFYGFYEDQFIFDSILMWTEKMFDVDYSQHIRGWMSATRKYTGVTILRHIHLGHWIKIDWEKSICCVVIARLYIIVLEVENNVLYDKITKITPMSRKSSLRVTKERVIYTPESWPRSQIMIQTNLQHYLQSTRGEIF